jgi:hypothetical protein
MVFTYIVLLRNSVLELDTSKNKGIQRFTWAIIELMTL